MAKVIFITQSEERIELEAQDGSLMELAQLNSVEGIDGDCGGVCSCATCHVHVAPDDFDKLAPAEEIEIDMLELDDNATEYSRLTCQIQMSELTDGMTFKVVN